MSLPTEILDKILSLLQSDVDTLKACSSASPILSQLVERHLYANITFQDTPGLTTFRKLLQDRPYISNYIRTLEIKFDIRPFLEEISSLLPACTSMLRRITLVYTGRVHLSSSWRMPEKFHLAFLECLRLPSLTDICIEEVPFPLSILSHCKHLKSLSLRSWSRPEGDNTHLPTIDTLALHHCYPDSLSTIVDSIQPSSLTFSGSDFNPSSFKTLPRILASYSHSLTNLDVDIGNNYRSHYSLFNPVVHDIHLIPISLSVLPHLQHLTIRAQLKQKWFTNIYGWFSQIPAITNVVKSASSLRRLTLDIYFLIEMDSDKHHMTDVLCFPLHSLLVQSASIIGCVDFRINSMEGSDSPDAILALFTGHPGLMQFVEDGTLTVTPVVA